MQIGETAAAAAGGAALTYTATRVFHSIKVRWANYSDVDVAKLKELQKLYRQHCLPTNSRASAQAASDQDLPKALRFDENNPKQPWLGKDFQPILVAHDYRRRLGSSLLSQYIRDLLGYLCQYQVERSIRWFGSGYKYDPCNMFLEALKEWLVDLSKQPVIGTSQEVEGYLKFIEAVHHKPSLVKSDRDKEVSLAGSLAIVSGVLEKMLHAARLYESRSSAREDAQALLVCSQDIVSDAVSCLFYGVNSDTLPVNFILEALRDRTHPSYANVGQLGRAHFLAGLAVQPAVVALQEGDHAPWESLLSLSDSPYLDDQRALVSPETLGMVSREDAAQNTLGLLPYFCEKTDTLKNFIQVAASVQELALFGLIAKHMYELAGDGGDIAVYCFMARGLEPTLARVEALLLTLESCLDAIESAARGYLGKLDISTERRRLDPRFRLSSELRAILSGNHGRFLHFRGEIHRQIEDFSAKLRGVRAQIRRCQQAEYKNLIHEKIRFFEGLTRVFVEFAPQVSQTPPLPQFQASGLLPPPDHDATALEREGNHAFSGGDYGKALEKYNLIPVQQWTMKVHARQIFCAAWGNDSLEELGVYLIQFDRLMDAGTDPEPFYLKAKLLGRHRSYPEAIEILLRYMRHNERADLTRFIALKQDLVNERSAEELRGPSGAAAAGPGQ